jgi:hypothetical protein
VLGIAGSGYISPPRVYLTGGGGTGATAVALLNGSIVLNGKNLVEGFDMEYGRMNAVLGSTPSILAPTVGAGPVMGAAFYVDPPTEVLTDGQPILWRISHIGVDSHAIHFHLFNVQVINRVDWTNTIKPPYPDELGWRETIRTNPFEDIIVAIKPSHMTIPFSITSSNRMLDPTNMAMFLPVAPPPGIPAVAQTTNVMTNFGWEYVWHCHLLGHEENDMMRPMVFQPGPTSSYVIPLYPRSVTATAGDGRASVTWTAPAGNGGSSINGYFVKVFTSTPAAPLGVDSNAGSTSRTHVITGLLNGASYTFTVRARNAAGTGLESLASNSVTPITPPPPAAPTNLVATVQTGPLRVRLTWTDNASNETGFVVERADNGGAFVQIAAPGPSAGTGNTVTYTDSTVVAGNSYAYQVKAVNGGGPSAYSNTVTPTLPTLPAAPSNLTVTAVRNGSTDLVTLNWTDNSNNETNFKYQRATNATFTGGSLVSYTLAPNLVTVQDSPRARNTNYYYRIQSLNAAGGSAWVNATPFPILTP